MAISVGSVSVDVVPSARNFSRELQAQLADQNVTVNARLDEKGVREELAVIGRDRELALGLQVDDRAAEAKLREVTRPRTVKVKVDDGGSIKKAEQQSVGLLSTLALLAPAAAPLVGVAAGGAAALGALGVTGILAFKGLSAEMKSGSADGEFLASTVKGLRGDLTQLEGTAAHGVLNGLIQSAEIAQNDMPGLRHEVGLLSASIGSDLAPATHGTLALFQDLEPVINSISGDVHSAAVGFDNWASGPGGIRFANYLATELPIVGHALQAIVTAGGHLVVALLPLGNAVLGGITDLSNVIAHIPVGVIQDLFVAFGAYKVVQFATLATALYAKTIDRLGFSAEAAAKKMAVLDAAEAAEGKGGKGGLGGILSIGRGLANKAPAAAGLGVAGALGAVAVGGVALGAAGANIIQQHGAGLDNKAADSIASGGQAGLASAQARLASYRAELARLTAAQIAGAKAGGAQQQEALGLTPKVEQLQTKTRDLSVAVGIASTEMQKNGVATTQAQFAQQAAARATALLNAEADKLISTLDAESAKVLGLRDSNIAWHQSLADAQAALKADGRTLDLNTAKGRANATALDAVAAAAVNHADKIRASGGSVGRLNAVLDSERNKLILVAEKFGMSATKAKAYADAILGIPPKVTTRVDLVGLSKALAGAHDLDTALRDAARFGAAAVQSTHGTFGASGVGSQKPYTGGYIAGGVLHRDFGGPVYGPGTGTSDSIPAMLSNGEFVMRSAAVAAIGVKNLARMNALGSKLSASGQQAGLTIAPTGNNYYSYDPTKIAKAHMLEARKALAVAGI